MTWTLVALNFQKQIKCEELIQHKTKTKTYEKSSTPSGCLFLGTNVLWKQVPMRKIIISQAMLKAILDSWSRKRIISLNYRSVVWQRRDNMRGIISNLK